MSAAMRQVIDNCIYSRELPAALVQVEPALRYAGSQEFVLYSIAHAEQHIFVDADEGGDVQRLVWVQFEGFLPANDKTYNYSGGEAVILGPYQFVHHSAIVDVATQLKEYPDSDTAYMMRLLGATGYRREGWVVIHRYVYVDPTKRHELMIIYSETLASTSFAVAALNAEGAAEAQWPALERASHARALACLTISPAP